ncbi:MAG: glycosyl transferase [Planctomycetota bacterium]|nr:MAG: glycosyl transferase [Planctomycetota bacterium]REK43372.1 MAG: glycosyl transferase [Planctomycetota bacterium]
MADFSQSGQITTLHDLGSIGRGHLEELLVESTVENKLGLVLPVTASDMRAAPFDRIVEQLKGVEYIDQIVVVLGIAPDDEDYLETQRKIAPLGSRAQILWTDGTRVAALYDELNAAGFNLAIAGKGRSVWTAFGYLLADPELSAFVLHDCDIVTYDRELLARLCLPMAHPSLDFEFCKAYYARRTDRMHGRTVRLLVWPLLRSLISVLGPDPFLVYMDSFRYPLAGEFAVTARLARSNRIPSDWGLEVGTLAEVFRNTSVKRVCQVDITSEYEHKHQSLSLDDPNKGLMRMAGDILTSIFRTLASRGTVMTAGHFVTLRSAYLRAAQDAIRQYHADALMNGLEFDRHAEEIAVEGFAQQVTTAGEVFQQDPAGGEAIANWARVLAALPDFPQRLRAAACDDARQFSPDGSGRLQSQT